MQRASATSCLFLGFVLLAGHANAENMTLCGASARGLYSIVAAGIDSAVRAADPGSTVTYQTSSGGYANIVQVVRGTCEFGLANIGEIIQARTGEGPFDGPVKGFSAVAMLFEWVPMQWVMTKEFSERYQIRSLDDIAKRKPPLRLIVNRRGIISSYAAERALDAVGVTFTNIEEWGGNVAFQDSTAATELMQNRRADAYANAFFVGGAIYEQIAHSVPIVLLDVPPASLDAVAGLGEIPFKIPAGSYSWLDRDISTHTTRTVVLVRETMDEALVYKFAKALIDHVDELRAVHDAIKALTPELMASVGDLPMHPGAIRAFREAGLR